jgi:8-oxo-dGTP diphosphatase
MVGYVKGTDVGHELTVIREAVARIGAAMQSDQDVAQAFADATALERLGSEISREASDFRAWFAAELNGSRGIPQSQLAQLFGMSPGRVGQLVRAGREQRWRGNPVMDPGTIPLQPPVVLAIVTSPHGVLIAHRRDERPPWTFPGGDIQPGESPADAAIRKVTAEAGISVKPMAVLGSRVHPRTSRHVIYLAAQPEDDQAEPVIGDADDLDAVEYAGLDTVRQRMPDMYEAVRMHLEAVLGAIEQF